MCQAGYTKHARMVGRLIGLRLDNYKYFAYPRLCLKKRLPAVCLLIDGRESHTNVDILWECNNDKVNLMCLPSRVSHDLQLFILAFSTPLKDCCLQLIEGM